MTEARAASQELLEQPACKPTTGVKHPHNIESEVNESPVEEEKYSPPTEAEGKTLRRIAARLPLVSFSLCFVEFAERASYYGAKTVFSNFIQFPLPEGTNASYL